MKFKVSIITVLIILSAVLGQIIIIQKHNLDILNRRLQIKQETITDMQETINFQYDELEKFRTSKKYTQEVAVHEK